LVTPDEVPQPRRLAVRVRITDAAGRERFAWQGSSAEYSHSPEEVIRYLHTVFVPPPGTVIGMGTIPDCTGLDNDRWLLPGDAVEITFDALGTLRQQVPARLPRLERSRWPARPELAGSGNGDVV
jgi:2-keto-4-pentenoate hydratase/2-oxohepta-3-ene-1,7-dioic acid hydratase in catechol pathway